ncbi:pectate lyase [Streptomyces sp. NPDC048275]|uniref:pectate lyase n=1 Tax=Streptomyces sp. NPDC048275 TaxID=3155629 RepID=UPI00340C8CDF
MVSRSSAPTPHRKRRGRLWLIGAVTAGLVSAAVAGGVALATDDPPSAASSTTEAPVRTLASSPAEAPARTLAFPEATGEQAVAETQQVSGTFDGELQRFVGTGALGGGDQEEGQDPIFELADGAVLKNVILGAPAADGVHCLGSCTLDNVFWEDVGEDAATFLGESEDATYLVTGGGATKAEDKVFQFNGNGTLTVRGFEVSDFGKLARTCGNCSEQFQRDIVLEDVTATAPGSELAGINSNLGDTARLSNITIVGDAEREIVPCQKFEGVTEGEPTELGSDADGTNCVFAESDITFQ